MRSMSLFVIGLWLFVALYPVQSWARAKPGLADCRVDGHPSEVMCGVLSRALDPARPEVKIDIHYVVVPSLARLSTEAPLFFFAGGPGQSAIALSGQMTGLFGRLNQRRDLVFVDQRGTGKSSPLRCAEAAKKLPLSALLDTQFQMAQLRQCQEQLSNGTSSTEGKDLRFFATTLAMQDIDAVRERLGYKLIDLIGGSYGTRAALEYHRLFPDRVRRMLLDGVAPPDMVLPLTGDRDSAAALQRVLQRCAADAACAKAYPQLETSWAKWLGGLPLSVSLTHPLSRQDEKITVTEASVLAMIRPILYVPALASALPYALSEATQGRLNMLFGLSRQLGGGSAAMKLAEGMHFSVICSEDAPLLPKDTSQEKVMGSMYRQVCAKWPKAAIDPAFYQVGQLKAGAAMILSGGADPVTPPIHGERVAKALGALARHVVIANVSHGVMTAGCMPDVVFQFFNTKDTANALKVDTACADKIPAPLFYFPANLKDAAGD
jgi:pimeloyl-ACP methyl ester carboxylesterase